MQLRQLREAAGLTQRELGNRIGVSGQAVAQWETGVNIRSTEPGISDLCQDFVIPNLRLRDLGILDYSRIHEPNGFHQAVSFFLSRFV